MNKERNLLPWVLGGLSLATVAAAMTVVVAGKPLTPSVSPASAEAAQVTAAPALLLMTLLLTPVLHLVARRVTVPAE